MSDNNAFTQGAVNIRVQPARNNAQNGKNKKKGPKPNPRPKSRNTNSAVISAERKIIDRLLRAPVANTTAIMSRSGNPPNIAKLPSQMPSSGDYVECLGMQIPRRLIYLAALVCPREFEGIRLPDPWTRAETATYQAKKTFNIKGVQAATGVLANTADAGRFAFVLNPCVSDNLGYSTTNNGWQLGLIDGPITAISGTATWPGAFLAPGAINGTTYLGDQYQDSWVGTSTEAMMLKARPVSASVLASYNGQLINGGGNIAIHCVPGDSWETNLVQTSAVYNMAQWEGLANVKKAYDGPLVQGAYAIWLPDNETDYLLYDVRAGGNSSTYGHAYPQIVCSGQISGVPPTVAGSGAAGPSLRVDMYINFEYTTNTRQIEAEHGPDDIMLRVKAIRALKRVDISMPNEMHIDWIKTILAGAAGFAAAGPIGAALAAASVATGTSLMGLKGK